ncbi:MAG: hypothetical protein AAGH79_17690, partial [Bacteroidota bacterium]
VIVGEYYSNKYPDRIEFWTFIEENYEQKFDHKDEMEMAVSFEFNWDEEDPDSLRKICPNLYDKYWDNPMV